MATRWRSMGAGTGCAAGRRTVTCTSSASMRMAPSPCSPCRKPGRRTNARPWLAARASAVRAGAAPSAWTDLAFPFAARGHAETADIAAIRRQLPWARGEATLLAGCEALARGGQDVRDALFVAEKLGVPLGLAAE